MKSPRRPVVRLPPTGGRGILFYMFVSRPVYEKKVIRSTALPGRVHRSSVSVTGSVAGWTPANRGGTVRFHINQQEKEVKILQPVKLPQLSPRLALAASFVRDGSRLADIGTDHAYLPVYLLKTGKCPKAIAADINEGPLARARLTAWQYGISDNLELRLSDGLDGLPADTADDIVAAGMGGELIADMILRCEWLRNSAKRLILQPMTAQDYLRRALCENGFSIYNEDVAYEPRRRKYYLVINAGYTGRVFTPDALYAYAGILPRTGGKFAVGYLEKQAETLKKRAAGLLLSHDGQSEAKPAAELAEKLTDLIIDRGADKNGDS